MNWVNVFNRVKRLCDNWEANSPPLPPDARHLLRRMARAIVLDAAALCAARASQEGKPWSKRCEANTCAGVIRHFLLCEEGESVCPRCDCVGRVHCNHEGVKR